MKKILSIIFLVFGFSSLLPMEEVGYQSSPDRRFDELFDLAQKVFAIETQDDSSEIREVIVSGSMVDPSHSGSINDDKIGLTSDNQVEEISKKLSGCSCCCRRSKIKQAPSAYDLVIEKIDKSILKAGSILDLNDLIAIYFLKYEKNEVPRLSKQELNNKVLAKKSFIIKVLKQRSYRVKTIREVKFSDLDNTVLTYVLMLCNNFWPQIYILAYSFQDKELGDLAEIYQQMGCPCCCCCD